MYPLNIGMVVCLGAQKLTYHINVTDELFASIEIPYHVAIEISSRSDKKKIKKKE